MKLPPLNLFWTNKTTDSTKSYGQDVNYTGFLVWTLVSGGK